MRFYTNQHRYYCGIDLHARSMYVCILDSQGQILLHRNMACVPELFLKAIAPYREDIAVAVECIFTWYWLADLCGKQNIPFVLGHASWEDHHLAGRCRRWGKARPHRSNLGQVSDEIHARQSRIFDSKQVRRTRHPGDAGPQQGARRWKLHVDGHFLVFGSPLFRCSGSHLRSADLRLHRCAKHRQTAKRSGRPSTSRNQNLGRFEKAGSYARVTGRR